MRDQLPSNLVLLFSLILSPLLVRTSQKQCLDGQRSILVQLCDDIQKVHHDNSSWIVRSWSENDTKDCCLWEAVTCDEGGYVVELDLSNGLIAGGISSIFRLGHLQRLNLAGNNFGGIPIPSGFGNLEDLTHLNLSMSSFSGQIPRKISLLSKLVSLDLSSPGSSYLLALKEMTLEEFIQNFTTLKELNLEGVDLSTQGADWGKALADALPDLEALNLAGCGLSGPIHPSLSRLRSLSHLNLGSNDFSASTVLEFFADFSHLTSLSLSSCRLRGEFPVDVFLLPKLQIIDILLNEDLVVKLPEFSSNSSLKRLLLGFTNISTGRLPNSVGNLQHLETLDVQGCNLFGSIPSSFQNLTILTKLGLAGNSFTGSVPSGLFALPSLQVLYLQNNQLIGPIPQSFSQLAALRVLWLSNNKFTGTMKLDLVLQSWKNLVSLDLSYNSLSVETDHSNFTIPQLRLLGLASCNLTEFPNFLRNNIQLEFLDLSSNQIKGSVPSWIWNISSLATLELSYNLIDFLQPSSEDEGIGTPTKISNANYSSPELEVLILQSCNVSHFPSFLKRQDNVKQIDLSNNKIHGQVPNWIWKVGLYYLNLSYNGLNSLGQFLPSNTSSTSLQLLDLHSNKLQGSFPAALVCNASSSLQILDLSYNHFSGLIPVCLGTIKTLEVLNLNGNNFGGLMHAELSLPVENLRSLSINGNQLQGMLPKFLANCIKMKVLDLGNNNISGIFPYWLGKLPSLSVLVLRNNSLKGSIELLPTSGTFPMLHILDLSSNDFSGQLSMTFLQSLKGMHNIVNEDKPSVKYIGDSYYKDSVTLINKGLESKMVKILTYFTSLDLSNNRFQGTIPEEIGSLQSLVVLNISRNGFESKIPSSIGKLTELESLDLSHNELSGRIPSQLTSLTFLGAFDLSHNKLEGPVLQGNHFDTFPHAYDGNPKLCGLLLFRKCAEALPPIAAKDDSSEPNSSFHWEYAWMGYGSGLVIGVSISYIILSRIEDDCFMDLIDLLRCRARQIRKLICGSC